MRPLRLLLPLMTGCAAWAGIVVSVESTTPVGGETARITSANAFATSWTQTGSYQNVSVAALLAGSSFNPPQADGEGLAWLMTAVGAGALAIAAAARCRVAGDRWRASRKPRSA